MLNLFGLAGFSKATINHLHYQCKIMYMKVQFFKPLILSLTMTNVMYFIIYCFNGFKPYGNIVCMHNSDYLYCVKIVMEGILSELRCNFIKTCELS